MTHITIPADMVKDLVEKTVKVAVTEALGEKGRDALVTSIVRLAVEAKRNNYDRETIIETAFKELVERQARECIAELMKEHEADIKKKVRAMMQPHASKFVDAVSKSMVDAATTCSVSVRMGNGWGDR